MEIYIRLFLGVPENKSSEVFMTSTVVPSFRCPGIAECNSMNIPVSLLNLGSWTGPAVGPLCQVPLPHGAVL